MARYEGGCQCGRVRFSADVDMDSLISCNCSRCGRLGSILTFTSADAFSLERGQDALTEFKFNTDKISHLFCAMCGVQSFGRGVAPDGREMIAVNARCLDGVDVFALKPQEVDGKSF